MARRAWTSAPRYSTFLAVFLLTLALATAYLSGGRKQTFDQRTIKKSFIGLSLMCQQNPKNCPVYGRGRVTRKLTKDTQEEAKRALEDNAQQFQEQELQSPLPMPAVLPPLSALLQQAREMAKRQRDGDYGSMTGAELGSGSGQDSAREEALLRLLRRQTEQLLLQQTRDSR